MSSVIDPNHRQGWNTVTVSTALEISTSPTLLLAPNSNRRFFYIANNSQNMVYLQLASDAIYGRGIRLNAGGVFSLGGDECFTGAISAVSLINTQLDILEGE